VSRNLWTAHAETLADAYLRSSGDVRFELVTRALLQNLPSEPQRVVDVGGGFGRQAIMLARARHSVIIIDLDPRMLAIARQRIAGEPLEVRSRIALVLGDGENAESLVGEGFDLACCHSVLMYQEDPAPMLSGLVKLVRVGGLISVLCLNKAASAMRSGLQGNWQEAARSLELGSDMGDRYLPGREHTPDEVTKILSAAGATIRTWYGVGVFTDHLTEALVVDDPEQVFFVEWLAGRQDPYRQVARSFHIIAERSSRSTR